MSKLDGGPAFSRYDDGSEGMSLRDWFAGQALAGVCANQNTHNLARMSPEELKKFFSHGCYVLADAMLAEREKE